MAGPQRRIYNRTQGLLVLSEHSRYRTGREVTKSLNPQRAWEVGQWGLIGNVRAEGLPVQIPNKLHFLVLL